jgi:hypothetical protein
MEFLEAGMLVRLEDGNFLLYKHVEQGGWSEEHFAFSR